MLVVTASISLCTCTVEYPNYWGETERFKVHVCRSKPLWSSCPHDCRSPQSYLTSEGVLLFLAPYPVREKRHALRSVFRQNPKRSQTFNAQPRGTRQSGQDDFQEHHQSILSTTTDTEFVCTKWPRQPSRRVPPCGLLNVVVSFNYVCSPAVNRGLY